MDKRIDQEKLNKIIELNRRLTRESDFNKKIKIISKALKDILKVDRCTIFLHDKSSKSLWSVYADGVSYIEVPDTKGIVSEAYNSKKTIILNSVQNDPRFNQNIDKSSGYVTNSILTMPILGFGDRALGVIQLLNKIDGSGGFTKEDEEILSYIISHISAYLELISDEG